MPLRWRSVLIPLISLLAVLISVPALADSDIYKLPSDLEQTLKGDLSRNPNAPTAIIPYARFLARQDRTSEASGLVSRLKDKSSPQALLLQAEINWYSGLTEAAREKIRAIPPKHRTEWIPAQELLARIEGFEGKRTSCARVCENLLQQDPSNIPARACIARLQIDSGKYAEADKIITALRTGQPGNLTLNECQAELLDAQCKPEEAAIIRNGMASIINQNPPDSMDDLHAAAVAMRHLYQPKAAGQCIDLAGRYSPADPAIQLERANLFLATTSYAQAAKIGNRLYDKYKKSPQVFLLYANIREALKIGSGPVKVACEEALALDPDLLRARNRLIHYDIIASDWSAAESHIAQNRKYNHAHILTEQQAAAISTLKMHSLVSNTPTSTTLSPYCSGPSFQNLLGELLAARSSYTDSAACYEKALSNKPDDLKALKGIGVSRFRLGGYDDAASNLENAFRRDPYDLNTKNLLDLLDKLRKTESTTAGLVTIAYGADDATIVPYATQLATTYLEREIKRYRLQKVQPIRLDLCSGPEDLGVATIGMPFGCCNDKVGPTGVTCFRTNLFVWTPGAASLYKEMYRFDEGLYRAIAQYAVQCAASSHIPVWMREGLVGYSLRNQNPEWMPINLDTLLGYLHGGATFPLRTIEAGFSGGSNSLLRAYAFFVMEDWIGRFGFNKILTVLDRLKSGDQWIPAVESAFGEPLDSLDSETREAILKRYESVRVPEIPAGRLESVAEGASYSDEARIDLARSFLESQRFSDAKSALEPLLKTEAPPTEAALLSGRIAWSLKDPQMAIQRLRLGLALEKARGEAVASSMDYESLGLALAKTHREAEAIPALEKALEMNPWDRRKDGAGAKLLQLLTEKNPKPEPYYQAMELYILGHRAAADERLELAQWAESKGEFEKAFAYCQSAAGIRPASAEIHTALGALAMRLKKTNEAYTSWKIILAARPSDRAALQNLVLCAKALGKPEEASRYQSRLVPEFP